MREPSVTTLKPLRERRNYRERDISIAAAVGELTAGTIRQARQVDGAGDAWSQVIPPELAAKASMVRLSRGTLQIRVADSAVRFALDRFLRSRGERALVEASKGKIKRIKLI